MQPRIFKPSQCPHHFNADIRKHFVGNDDEPKIDRKGFLANFSLNYICEQRDSLVNCTMSVGQSNTIRHVGR